jgi:hypothetical protein
MFAGVRPNCMPLYYDFPLDFPAQFYPYIPNVYHLPPPWLYRAFGEKTLMRSYVITAVCCCECVVFAAFLMRSG